MKIVVVPGVDAAVGAAAAADDDDDDVQCCLERHSTC